ncbi:cytochrome C oxidase subunit IV family protein [Nocardia takedensis]|uniref:cytochrome C oxidase subunit IV family protein n=1 Tax=Nocardia takedensis TaxID=259390 RepID=UPI000593E613|nr:cytochrome C oxidase subunit IV family protein [Nocardia takedensis]
MTTDDPTRHSHDRRVLVWVWLILAATTVLAWQFVPGHAALTTDLSDEFVTAIVVLALIKCRLIFRYFMEVRSAPRWLRIATDLWLIVLWAALLGIYLWT